MGGWALEVGKMVIYMSFPVAMFHYFNQPEYFEKWVTDKKRELFPPENKSHREEFEQCVRSIREASDNEMLKALDEIKHREKQ